MISGKGLSQQTHLGPDDEDSRKDITILLCVLYG